MGYLPPGLWLHYRASFQIHCVWRLVGICYHCLIFSLHKSQIPSSVAQPEPKPWKALHLPVRIQFTKLTAQDYLMGSSQCKIKLATTSTPPALIWKERYDEMQWSCQSKDQVCWPGTVQQMWKPRLYLCCEGVKKGAVRDLVKESRDVSDHWSHMEAGRERIKEHLRLDLRKAASASEEAGQHRGRISQAHGTHSLIAEEDWQPVQHASCTTTSIHWHHLLWRLQMEHHLIIHRQYSHTRNTPLLPLMLEQKNPLKTLFLPIQRKANMVRHHLQCGCWTYYITILKSG